MLDFEKAREWSVLGHVSFIEAFLSTVRVDSKKFAFHGGTSLHLSWQSPRFSEDLDFLLSRDMGKKIVEEMPKVKEKLTSILKSHDPGFIVDIKDKTKDNSRLLNFMVILSHPQYHGNVKIKAEFWQVDTEYLDKYQTKFARPVSRTDYLSVVSQPLPAATLEAAYADKLTAFATRPHLKWRDLFDLWWIERQINVTPEDMARKFLHHVKAYNTVEGLKPSDALLHFLTKDPDEIASMADPDLKKWLPKSLWENLEGRGVNEIVECVRDNLKTIAQEAAIIENEEPKNG